MTLRTWLVLWACLVASTARADTLRSTLQQPIREISHTVDVTIVHGIATYKVRRVFANTGTIADEANLLITLPYGAAATGLRIRARDRWYDGELLEAESAAQRYLELTGLGKFRPKDPALLSWWWTDRLNLQVFPVMPGATSTVEYTLTVPTTYHSGRIFLSYPRGNHAYPPNNDGEESEFENDPASQSAPLAKVVVTLRPSWGDATTTVMIDGYRAAPDTPLLLPESVHSPWALTAPDEAITAGNVVSTMQIDSKHVP
jgi:hypothetical protein